QGKSADHALLIAVAVTLFIVAFITIMRALFMPRLIERERHAYQFSPPAKGGAVALGAVLGFTLGVTSVGSGALVGLALILVFRLTPHRVVGTDVFHAALLLWVAGVAHWISGNVDFTLMANILIGSLPGVYIATLLLPRVPPGALRPVPG